MKYSDFRSLRGKVAWATNTRLDICCAVACITKMTEERFVKENDKDVKHRNRVVAHIQKSKDFRLKLPTLEKNSLTTRVYSDASICIKTQSVITATVFIFFRDENEFCQPLYWISYKGRRVHSSIIASKVMPFANAFNMSSIIKPDLYFIYNSFIQGVILTDSLSLFGVITNGATTTDRRLMIDFRAI